MDTKYQTLLDELHTNKRELSNYRQKCLNIESQLIETQQENRKLKKNDLCQKDEIQRLNDLNKFLLNQKQSLMNQCSASIESVKDQINKKQQEIYYLKQTSYSPLMTHKLLEKQIKLQIQKEFQQRIQIKQKRSSELQHQIDQINFDRQIEAQKYAIKVQSLERQLKEMQNSHLAELQNYANKTFRNSQNTKISEEQSLIKKLRRQIDQLRITLDHATQQLSQSISQKTKLQKEHSLFITKFNKQVEKYAEEIRLYQAENKKLSEVQGRSKVQKDQLLMRQKDKQIKLLKQKVEEFHELINKKDSRISEIEVTIVQLVTKAAQIKKSKQFNLKHQNEKIQELKIQKQSLQREIAQFKKSNENIRKQNLDLMNSISQIQSQSMKNIKETSNFISRNINQQKYISINSNTIQKHKRQFSIAEQANLSQQCGQLQNQFRSHDKPGSSNNMKNQSLENQKKYYQKRIQEQNIRNKELATKYVQLKKKYKTLQQKFKQANLKVVQLLKNKIQFGSPTAASKKTFQFPVSPDLKYSRSPQILATSNKFHQNFNYSKTQGKLNALLRNNISSQNQVFQIKRGDKLTQQKDKRSKSQKSDNCFYEKSLKIKNSHKYKQIKCLNHDDLSQNKSLQCFHSPIKLKN